MPSSVTVHYPFHPLVNRTLTVVTWLRCPDQAVTVLHPDGTAIKLPLWMLQAEAASISVCDQTLLSANVLLELLELLSVHASSMASAQRHTETEHEAGHLPIRRLPVEPA